ncbi:MAG: hypothetical protein K0R99_3780 [Microbacterium sp.]|jgi:enhancing lycopene biosynthesis protein 2|uniref:histone-like nucleoid-structuring protein Lsr2 n=1 Tax=Microbacterium sp. TaxID=51671 RepID=UPI00262C5F89|nr:Lsr2 family protein [Microbacterium sp.]MDF2562334.1 hypothetical protein [Microbacterium sp.]
MARKTRTVYDITDDLTGETLSEDEAVNIEFSYGGRSYSIDLSKKNADKFDDVIKPYLDAATPQRGTATSKPGKNNSGKRTDLDAVRAWASSNGYEVSSRGRVAKTILDAYDAAH